MQSTSVGRHSSAAHAAADQVQFVADCHQEACPGGEHGRDNGRNGESQLKWNDCCGRAHMGQNRVWLVHTPFIHSFSSTILACGWSMTKDFLKHLRLLETITYYLVQFRNDELSE